MAHENRKNCSLVTEIKEKLNYIVCTNQYVFVADIPIYSITIILKRFRWEFQKMFLEGSGIGMYKVSLNQDHKNILNHTVSSLDWIHS